MEYIVLRQDYVTSHRFSEKNEFNKSYRPIIICIQNNLIDLLILFCLVIISLINWQLLIYYYYPQLCIIIIITVILSEMFCQFKVYIQ